MAQDKYSMEKFLRKISTSHWLILFLTTLFLLLPNQNPSSDSIGYVACVKHQMYLYAAHHLLYNPFMLMLHKLFGFGCDVLAFTSVINAIFAGFSLWVINEILLVKTNFQKTFF
jgi:hypothetical protein